MKFFRYHFFLSIFFFILMVPIVMSILFQGQRYGVTSVLAATDTNTSYDLGLFVLRYFPLTSDGANIDINVTGDWGASYVSTRQKTIDMTNNLLTLIPKATSYKGYQNAVAIPSIRHHVVETIEELRPVPMLTDGTRRPDYNQLLTENHICYRVDTQGVREVWIWAYNGPTYPGSQYPYLNISESKMAGPHGDISNSARTNDMPICNNTYRVYTFNYQRGTSEALHSWGHQIEAEIKAVNSSLFQLFQGPNYPQTLGVVGRCGSQHNPPNARSEYDTKNTTPQNSDCLDWQPDGQGALTQISCTTWGCTYVSDTNNPTLNYMIWNWQNMPGRGNTKIHQGKQLRNWWDIHGAFDNVMKQDKTLYLTPPPSPSPTPRPTPSPTPYNTTYAEVYFTYPSYGAYVNKKKTITMKAAPANSVPISKVEFLVDGVRKCTDYSSPYTCNWYVPNTTGVRYSLWAKAYGSGGTLGSTTTINVFSR